MLAKHFGKVFPNGYPIPDFMYTTEEGWFCIEWIFGNQGADDSWRLSFTFFKDEPAMLLKTDKNGQESIESPEKIAEYLDKWLKEAI